MTEEDGFARPRVVMVQRLSGFKAVAHRSPDGRVVLEGIDGARLPSLEQGEKLRILDAIEGDATYTTEASVVERVDEQGVLYLEATAQPRRDQQRAFARVGVPETVLKVSVEDSDAEGLGDLVNISAGGARATVNLEGIGPGMRLRLEFSLPKGRGRAEAFELVGEVAWAGRTRLGKPLLGIRFLDPGHAIEAKIASWVLRQQATSMT